MDELKKFCGDCNTTKTPLWRSGPLGPRSLCNACGIRYRKRKMAEDEQGSSEFITERSISSKSDDYDDEDEIDESLKVRSDCSSYRVFVRRSSSSSSTSPSKLKKQRSNSEQSISSSDRNLGCGTSCFTLDVSFLGLFSCLITGIDFFWVVG